MRGLTVIVIAFITLYLKESDSGGSASGFVSLRGDGGDGVQVSSSRRLAWRARRSRQTRKSGSTIHSVVTARALTTGVSSGTSGTLLWGGGVGRRMEWREGEEGRREEKERRTNKEVESGEAWL